jgi:hypothetical protein
MSVGPEKAAGGWRMRARLALTNVCNIARRVLLAGGGLGQLRLGRR